MPRRGERLGAFADLVELDSVAVRVGDIDGQAVGAIVQVFLEMGAARVQAVTQRAHVVDLESDVIDLTMALLLAAGQGEAVVEGEVVRWTETCYCSPPLKAERPVLELYFDQIEVEPLVGEPPSSGVPLPEHLRSASSG